MIGHWLVLVTMSPMNCGSVALSLNVLAISTSPKTRYFLCNVLGEGGDSPVPALEQPAHRGGEAGAVLEVWQYRTDQTQSLKQGTSYHGTHSDLIDDKAIQF